MNITNHRRKKNWFKGAMSTLHSHENPNENFTEKNTFIFPTKTFCGRAENGFFSSVATFFTSHLPFSTLHFVEFFFNYSFRTRSKLFHCIKARYFCLVCAIALHVTNSYEGKKEHHQQQHVSIFCPSLLGVYLFLYFQ